jgi:hypothetical protein
MVEAWSPTRLNGSAANLLQPATLEGRTFSRATPWEPANNSTAPMITALLTNRLARWRFRPCPGRACDYVGSASDEMRHGSGEALLNLFTEAGLEPGRILVRGCQDDDFVGRELS